MRGDCFRLMTLALFAATGAAAEPHDSLRLYVNCELGFSLELPFYAPVCDIRLNNINSGATVFLDTGLGDCGVFHDERPLMSYHEWYNDLDYKNHSDVLGATCRDVPIVDTDPHEFAREASWLPRMCRRELRDGLFRLSFGGLSSNKAATLEATLQTTAERYDADLAAFLAMLRSMKRVRSSC